VASDELILARAERLCLLRALHVATKAHRSTRSLSRKLALLTARIAVLEVRHGS
jgi:hypothetical protein